MEPASPKLDLPRPEARRDLQGLRGFGVILVVVGHLFRAPHGVFSALDIFFVLSGFLISGILIDMHAHLGRIYFTPFYLARVRRLMPTAITVILVTVGLYYLLFSQARGQLVATDGAWALFFAANWHFVAMSTNYFQDQGESPFLHYWSLSVEEQFYVVWPLLLLCALVVARRSRRPQVVLVVALGLVTSTSFAYSLWHSTASPTVAYFSTLDRAWEFGVGGLIAAARPLLTRLPGWVARALGWGGFVGLALPIFLLSYGDPFPAPWALLPVLLTGAIIAGGVGRSTKHLFLLENPAMAYVGDISYSVYLWHLPIQLLLKSFLPPGSTTYYVTALMLTAIVSPLSYHLIERPMRYASWLMTPPERRRFTRRPRNRAKVRYGWMVVGAASFALMVAWTLSPRPTPVSSADTPPLPSLPTQARGLGAWQQARLAKALDQRTFPSFRPSLEQLGVDRWLQDQERFGCTSVLPELVDECRFGPAGATKHAVVVGDSVAISWMPGIRAALEPRGWSVQQLTRLECGSWTLPSYVHLDGTPYPKCEEHHRLVEQLVRREKPDLVILSSAAAQVRNSERPGFPKDGTVVARQGLRRTIAALSPSGASIVVLGPPAGSANLVDCVTRRGTPSDCVTRPSVYQREHVAGERAAVAGTRVPYVDTEDWFCVDRSCPAFVGRTPVLVDGTHLSLPFSEQLAPLLRQALLGAVRAKSTT